MKIVPVESIPKADITPTDDLVGLYKTCLKMAQCCEKLEGIGLSAVQVGIPWKLFVVKHADHKFGYYVNCDYEPENEDRIDSIERCLSLRYPDGVLKSYKLKRFQRIRVKGHILDDSGDSPLLKEADFSIGGFYGIVFQHEIDHHNNILISDIGKEVGLINVK